MKIIVFNSWRKWNENELIVYNCDNFMGLQENNYTLYDDSNTYEMYPSIDFRFKYDWKTQFTRWENDIYDEEDEHDVGKHTLKIASQWSDDIDNVKDQKNIELSYRTREEFEELFMLFLANDRETIFDVDAQLDQAEKIARTKIK